MISIDIDILQHTLTTAQAAVSRSDLSKIDVPRDFWLTLSEFRATIEKQSNQRNKPAAAAAGSHNKRPQRLPTCVLWFQTFPNGMPPRCRHGMSCNNWNCIFKHFGPGCTTKDCACEHRHITRDIPQELPANHQIVSSWVSRTPKPDDQSNDHGSNDSA